MRWQPRSVDWKLLVRVLSGYLTSLSFDGNSGFLVRSRRGGSRDRATNVHGGGQCDIVPRSRRRRATGREEKASEQRTREEEEVGQDAGAQEEGAEPRRFLFFFIGGTVPFLSSRKQSSFLLSWLVWVCELFHTRVGRAFRSCFANGWVRGW